MGVEITYRNNEEAVYMFKNAHSPEYFRCTEYNRYHEDWNLLMPVIDKIQNIELMGCQAYIDISAFNISAYCSGHLKRGLSEFNHQINGRIFLGEDRLQAVHSVIVDFITWYNNESEIIKSKIKEKPTTTFGGLGMGTF